MKMFRNPFKLFGIGKVGPKGQVVVPAEARSELGINPGDSVVVMGFPHKKAVIIVNEKTFQKYANRVRRNFDLFDEYENLKNDTENQGTKFND